MSSPHQHPRLALSYWHQAWIDAGAPGHPDETLHQQLLAAYAQPQRHYHTGQHLAECLELLDQVRNAAHWPAGIELALWFHDAVYDPLRGDNEALSATWLQEVASAQGLAPVSVACLSELVLATQHNLPAVTDDQRLLVDIDLAILGAEPARFHQYEDQVRQEYDFVPAETFRAKRAEILTRFLARPSIFATSTFSSLETPARRNLRVSLAHLRSQNT